MIIGYSLRIAMSVAVVPMANASTANPSVTVKLHNYVFLFRLYLETGDSSTDSDNWNTRDYVPAIFR